LILGDRAAPGALETLQKGGVLRPPPFGGVSKAHGVAQTPEIGDFRAAQKMRKIGKRR
jgi:hypothetical protein